MNSSIRTALASLLTRRTASLALLCLLIVAAGGCYDSLNPIVTKDNQVFLENLIGEYDQGKSTFTRGPDQSYVWTQHETNGKVQKLPVRLAKIAGELFYEVELAAPTPASSQPTEQPASTLSTPDGKLIARAYWIGRLTVDGNKVTFWAFEGDRGDLPKLDGVKSTQILVNESDGTTRKDSILSMSTAELQTFFAAHAKEMTNEVSSMTRTGDAH